jgi:hypothetical protein
MVRALRAAPSTERPIMTWIGDDAADGFEEDDP